MATSTPVIALDGPAGSGKSTVARAVASALGWRYVDTGATYRVATLAVLRAGVSILDTAAVSDLVSKIVTEGRLQLGTDPGRPTVVLAGEDVSAAVRGADVTAAVSTVSAIPAVRAVLVEFQREAIGSAGAVAEGRDVATVVAPDAALKVYLDADPAVRAGRRAADTNAGVANGGPDLMRAVAADLARRDAHDRGRLASPLAVAPEAVHLDATWLSADEVVAAVLALAADAGLH